MPAGSKKSACTLEDGSTHLVESSADRSDPTIDVSRDPAMEHKILSKIEALRERLVLWTRRLDEYVYLIQSILQCFIECSPILSITFSTFKHLIKEC